MERDRQRQRQSRAEQSRERERERATTTFTVTQWYEFSNETHGTCLYSPTPPPQLSPSNFSPLTRRSPAALLHHRHLLFIALLLVTQLAVSLLLRYPEMLGPPPLCASIPSLFSTCRTLAPSMFSFLSWKGVRGVVFAGWSWRTPRHRTGIYILPHTFREIFVILFPPPK